MTLFQMTLYFESETKILWILYFRIHQAVNHCLLISNRTKLKSNPWPQSNNEINKWQTGGTQLLTQQLQDLVSSWSRCCCCWGPGWSCGPCAGLPHEVMTALCLGLQNDDCWPARVGCPGWTDVSLWTGFPCWLKCRCVKEWCYYHFKSSSVYA